MSARAVGKRDFFFLSWLLFSFCSLAFVPNVAISIIPSGQIIRSLFARDPSTWLHTLHIVLIPRHVRKSPRVVESKISLADVQAAARLYQRNPQARLLLTQQLVNSSSINHKIVRIDYLSSRRCTCMQATDGSLFERKRSL